MGKSWQINEGVVDSNSYSEKKNSLWL